MHTPPHPPTEGHLHFQDVPEASLLFTTPVGCSALAAFHRWANRGCDSTAGSGRVGLEARTSHCNNFVLSTCCPREASSPTQPHPPRLSSSHGAVGAKASNPCPEEGSPVLHQNFCLPAFSASFTYLPRICWEMGTRVFSRAALSQLSHSTSSTAHTWASLGGGGQPQAPWGWCPLFSHPGWWFLHPC